MENKFFPLFIDITNKNILIIGAGKIAFRKASTLLEYGAKVQVITKEVVEKKFFDLKDVLIEEREFSENDLKDKFLVVAATDNESFNNHIYHLCNKKNILINNITSKVDMNARFVSTIENKEYQIGISAKGNPIKSKELKHKLMEFLEK